VLVDTTVTLVEGKYYTFVLYGYARAGSSPARKFMVMEDTPNDPAAKIGLRVVNLGADLGAVDAYVGLGATGSRPATPEFAAVPAGASSAQKDYDVGTYRFWFTQAGSAVDLMTAPSTAPAGTAGTVDQNPVPGTAVAGSVVTAFFFPRSVTGSTAQNHTAPGLIFVWDKRPPNTRPN
jgi:hypothetical protein